MSIEINPQDYGYAFRLSKYDCYRERTGKCSLHLTDEEYVIAKINDNYLKNYLIMKEGLVNYCRELSHYLVSNDIFSKGQGNDGIKARLHKCKHISFEDGQHRTCIAKQLGIIKLKVTSFSEEPSKCRVCSFKERNIKNDDNEFIDNVKYL